MKNTGKRPRDLSTSRPPIMLPTDEDVPYAERERSLALRVNISLQEALPVTSIEDICRAGLECSDAEIVDDCWEIIATIELLLVAGATYSGETD
jgi:hypothetical protein